MGRASGIFKLLHHPLLEGFVGLVAVRELEDIAFPSEERIPRQCANIVGSGRL